MTTKTTLKKILLPLFLLLLIPAIASAGKVGTKAPPFTLKDATGSEVSSTDFNGKVLFINFWASWCGPCKKEFPELIDFIGGYGPAEAVLLAVNIDKKRSFADKFLKEAGTLPPNMIVLYDPKTEVVSKFKTAAMPTSFLIDRNGRIRYIHLGFQKSSPERWVKEFNELLKEEGLTEEPGEEAGK